MGVCVISESHQGRGLGGISVKSLRAVIRKIWYSLASFSILTGSLAPERRREHWVWSYFLPLVPGLVGGRVWLVIRGTGLVSAFVMTPRKACAPGVVSGVAVMTVKG